MKKLSRSVHGDRIPIDGVKLSWELAQFNCAEDSETSFWTARLIRFMAENRINISFHCFTRTDRGASGSCCVAAEDFGAAKRILDREPRIKEHLDIIAPVGTLTLFPHRDSLALPGLVIHEFGKTGIPIHGIGTSISALTFSTDYRLLDRAVDVLQSALEIPANHAPFRPGFRVLQAPA